MYIVIFQITLGADQECPSDHELIALSNVAVSKAWLASTMAKCRNKGASFTIKKIIDGFYEPTDLRGQTASMLVKQPVMAALRCK